MPSWKKVILSGSDAALNSLTVTNGITGSLFGTASFASTASFLASTTNAFIQNGNSFGTLALLGTNDNQSLALETNGTTRMFISSSGAVGIGKTTPTATLDVSGSAIITGSLDLVYNTPSSNGISVTGHFPRLLLVNSGSGATAAGGIISVRDNNLTTKAGGAVVFSINATNAGDSSVGRIVFTKATNNSTNVSIWNSGTEGAFYISGSGDIGVGKTTPNARLDVSGSAIISGSFTVTPGTVREFQVRTTGVDIGNLITDTHTVTGSLSVSGSVIATSLTGSLFGTSSWAVSASWAPATTTAATASFVTGSNVYGPFGSNSIISASHATTASYALTSSFSLAASANTILVINKSGATISKGMVVHLTGSNNSSDTPYVITASYQSDQLSANTLGVAAESIAFNSTGYITTEGVLTGINVTGLVSGQLIYLGDAGSIIGSAPVAPLHSVRLGQVVRDSPSNNGAIYVRVDNGYELGELHDIIDSTTTSSYGDLLVKSGSVWTNSRQLTGSYGITGSLAQGLGSIASVQASHAEGSYTSASGQYSHAEGTFTIASGQGSHAEGYQTLATALYSHTEGNQTIASGDYSHAEGDNTQAIGSKSHAEGRSTTAQGNYSHAEGDSTTAQGDYSHAEGRNTEAKGDSSHAEGYSTSTGTQFAFYAQSVVSGVLTLDSGYGDVTSIFVAGNPLILSDANYDDNYGTTTFIIDSVTYSSPNTVITLTDTSVTTSEAVCGDVKLVSSWSSYSGDELIAPLYAHTEGEYTNAFNISSHAEGSNTVAGGKNSHAEGYQTTAGGDNSHAEGRGTLSIGGGSHAEGYITVASGDYSHAEGHSTVSKGTYSHAEGFGTIASGSYSHAEGGYTVAIGGSSHAEGDNTQAIGDFSHAEGGSSIASGTSSHAEGIDTVASGNYSHAEGANTLASGSYSHAEGSNTIASGSYSHAEGLITQALGIYSHTEGSGSIASGIASHAEGKNSQAIGIYSHAEGGTTDPGRSGGTAIGEGSHAEGVLTIAFGTGSHAEGRDTTSSGSYSHAEGQDTKAIGDNSHAEGYGTQAIGASSHAEGLSTVASGSYQHVQGQFNISSSAQSAFIIGNGTSNTSRSNLIFASGSIFQVTGSVVATQGFTGSLQGTASFTISSSYADAARTVGIATQDTTPITYNVTFTGGTSGNHSLNVDQTTLTYNPSTTTLAVTNLAGTASWAISASFASTASFLNGSTTNAFIQNGNSFGTTALLGTNDNNSLALETSGSTRMFISSSGNIGIGTTSTSNRLTVLDTANNITALIGGGTASPSWVGIGTVNSGVAPFIQGYNNAVSSTTNLALNPVGGNVGIGTTSPTAKLSVSGTIRAFGAGNAGIITSEDTQPGGAAISLNPQFSTGVPGIQTGNSPIAFYTNNSEKMRITSTGNVGIGTTSPNFLLDVSGSANITGSLNVGISTITTARSASSAAGANTLFTQATGSFTAAKYFYTVTSASNARTGEVMAVWNGTSVQYTDNSTLDIGSTTAVTASVSIVTAQAQFNMQTTNAGWTIKSQVTYL